jgi:hypothetical protein
LLPSSFAAGGSVPAVAKRLGRRWLATENDGNTALVARKRVGEAE